jgi:hypothetical protein
MATPALNTFRAYEFEGGFPTPDTIARAYDDADLVRAITAYRFFYPSVSALCVYKGNIDSGMVANRVFCVVRDAVGMSGFTMNSDTPYVGLSLDVSTGPIVIELPPGALMGAVNDLHQRWVMDIGLPGPDHGAGGKHLLLPPGHAGEVPAGHYAATPTTNRVLGLIRALPPHGDLDAGIALMKSVKVYPLDGPGDGSDVEWGELSLSLDYSPGPFETEIRYWEMLHDLIDTEPPYDAYRNEYGNLAALGIAKGHPFAPDQRMTRILLQAAQIASAQMRVQSLADRRPDRVVWDGRQWEWAVLRPENGTFDTDSYVDLEAREKWFYQAQIESPAMFARAPGAGSLYWLSARDSTGAYLDGACYYRLSVPLPVPDKLFWSITVYDAQTRTEIVTDQNQAALRSLIELTPEVLEDAPHAELHFSPQQPADAEGRWIKTIPGRGWFAYFRIYGPDAPAFDHSWQLPDFELTAGV